jgi:hypothetical protein
MFIFVLIRAMNRWALLFLACCVLCATSSNKVGRALHNALKDAEQIEADSISSVWIFFENKPQFDSIKRDSDSLEVLCTQTYC